ncbi:hypothetical protein [Francisella sp. SYW-9]|uniref:hypothetical protein n=1 Tax=Francisella sp. SYW-9 TaxID=2610888 RepID=UPI00123D7926|nr:hypothetical protein [Francisella sp. SYW-9]
MSNIYMQDQLNSIIFNDFGRDVLILPKNIQKSVIFDDSYQFDNIGSYQAKNIAGYLTILPSDIKDFYIGCDVKIIDLNLIVNIDNYKLVNGLYKAQVSFANGDSLQDDYNFS